MKEYTQSKQKQSESAERANNGSSEKTPMTETWDELWREGKERAREIGSLRAAESGIPPSRERDRN